jgi:predicted nuclease of predicted toxin-antitoxin system
MALRFLADHCISNTIVQTLRDAGHAVVRLRDVLAVESADAMVIAKAQDLDAILLSMNGDFADLVTYTPRKYKGIVALQMRNHPEVLHHLMVRLITYLKAYPAMGDYAGKLLVVEVNRIRIREGERE